MEYYQKFIFLRTYARWNEAEQRRETWPEAVSRYMEYMRSKLGNKLTKDEYTEIQDAIVRMDIMPSMRLLWTAGPTVDKSNASAYNCSFVTPTKIKRFGEILYLLTNGCGVGFSVESKYTEQLPVVEPQSGRKIDTFVVPDTREGWADAIVHGLRTWYDGDDVEFDYSKIRPLGTPLKTMGGRASGPAPLKNLLEHTKKVVLSRQGMKLRPIDVHDIITKIGEVVVAGGTRRSAQISLSDLNDQDMRDAKSGAFWEHAPHRAMANNSAVYTEKPDAKTFMREWLALVESGTGERGIFNRNGSLPERRIEFLGDKANGLGTNPCFHPDTIIETVNGQMKIKDMTSPTFVYTMLNDGSLGVRAASASWKTKENTDVVEVKVSTGKSLVVTPDHQIFTKNRGWVEAGRLLEGDVVVHLSRQRRGAKYIGIKLTNETSSQMMEHRLVWAGVHGGIPAGHDIHHMNGDTFDNDIRNLASMSHNAHATLTRYECENDHQVRGVDGKFISPPWSKNGRKELKQIPDELKSGLVNQNPTVVAVIPRGKSDVYDIMVEETHNVIANYIVAHNCGEIILQPQQFCNLTEVVARPQDKKADLIRKTRLASILGTFQSMLTDFDYLSAEWKRNCDDERLLGVSITGQCDCPAVRDAGTLSEMKAEATSTNAKYAKKFGINASTAVTTVKPSGTVSQLVNASSGIHPRYAPYYVRRVRIASTDPLFHMLRDIGVPFNPENGQTADNATTFVLEFPMKSPEGALTIEDMSALDQLEHWKRVKVNFTEHNPSCSVYVKDSEWVAVADWVYKNWDIVGGLSFFPVDSHVYPLAPLEKIDKKEYERRVKEMPVIDFENLKNYEAIDNTKPSLACEGQSCIIE